ncbi:MAG: hypothetical protein MK086_12505 [Flavobacteriales bacterium]|nr:hypothetical protein [Flavobacteriales bacterium]
MEKITRDNYEAFFLDFLEGSLDDDQRAEFEKFLELHPDLASELDEYEDFSLSPENEEAKWNLLKAPTLDDLKASEESRSRLYFRCAEGDGNSYDKKLLSDLVTEPSFKCEYELWQSLRLKSSAEEVDREDLYQLPLSLPITESNYEDFLIARTEGLLNAQEDKALMSFAAQLKSGSRDLALADQLRLEAPQGIFFPDKDQLKKKEKGYLFLYRAAAAILLLGLVGTLSILIFSDEPNAQYAQREKAIIGDKDTLEKVISQPIEESSDSIPEQRQSPKLEQWELLEPDPAFVAEAREEKRDKDIIENQPVATPEPVEFQEFAEVEPIDTLDQQEAPEVEVPELIAPGFPEEKYAEAKPEKNSIKYQTIGEIAEETVASTFDLTEREKDEMALNIAKKITQKAGEALDSELTKEVDNEKDRLTYFLRIRKFKVTHNRAK